MATAPTGKTFQFELVSPEKVLFSERAAMVTIPGEVGEFGVLADHAPLSSSLLPGLVTITREDGTVQKIYISGGFADVSDNVCAVLAEEAVNVEDIDKVAAREKVEALRSALVNAKNSGHVMEASSLTQELILAERILGFAA